MQLETTKNAQAVYESLRSRLIERLLSGQFSPGDRFHSVRDVAQWPGATAHLAQRALLDMCKEGYLESVPKRGLFVRNRANQSRNVQPYGPWRLLLLIVNPDTNRLRFNEMLPAVAHGFDSNHWRTEVIYLKENYMAEGGFRLAQSIISRHPTAILWLMPPIGGMLLVRHLISTGIPVVTYNRDFTDAGALSVICDVDAVAKQLLHAVWNEGKRRIIVLSVDRDSPSIRQFPDAALEGAREMGISDHVKHVLLPFHEPGDNEFVENALLAIVNNLMSGPDAPDGVVCAESFSLKCIELWLSRHRDIRVPADLAVASFDRQVDSDVVRVLPSIPFGHMDHDAMVSHTYDMVESELTGRRVEPKLKKVPAVLHRPKPAQAVGESVSASF